MAKPDPLSDPAPLIRTVYSYVAYRIGDGVEAEDVTSETFERALRYRDSYDETRGKPVSWLIGIARRCIAARSRPALQALSEDDVAAPHDLVESAADRITIAAAVARLSERDRELLALRYGGDLTARQIGGMLDLAPNAVEVALHRALSRLRTQLESTTPPGESRLSSASGRNWPNV
jgi:RNA polymerase sigma factor (sigma-70 family)